MARFLCHVCVERIPDRGLAELFESLSGMQEFYSELPETPTLPSAITQLEPTVGEIQERPGLTFDSDD